MWRNTKMPFILTESGFKSSTFDTALLKQGRFIDGLAKGHINGLVWSFDLNKERGG